MSVLQPSIFPQYNVYANRVMDAIVGGVGKDYSGLDIPLEIFQKEEHWFIKAYVPGVEKDDIHVDVDRGKIIISAVRHTPKDKPYLSEIEYGEMKTTVKVAALTHIKQENVEASHKDGVLIITVKKDPDSVPYNVTIN